MFHPPCILENQRVFLFLSKEYDYCSIFFFFWSHRSRNWCSARTQSHLDAQPEMKWEGWGFRALRSPAARNTEGAFLGSPWEGVGTVVCVWGSWCGWPSIWGHAGFCVSPGTAVRAVTQHPGALWSQPSLDDTAQLFIVFLGLITKNKPCRVTPEVTGYWIRLSFLAINIFAQLLRVQVVVCNSPKTFVTVTLPNM